MSEEPSALGSGGKFPTTRWSLILSARGGEDARRRALETLLATYWKPLYFYLRRKGLEVSAAEDAVQSLFAQLLERDFLVRLDPEKGRFRSYLRTTADHFLVNLWEKETAVKRGGEYRFIPLDVVLAERELPGAPQAPEQAFEREWALSLMEKALGRLRQEFEDGRRRGATETVLKFFKLDEAPSYAQAATECGMTAPQFKAALHRARVRFREILREEVAATVDDDAAIDQELSDLMRALAS